MPGGRPSKYDPEYCEKLVKHMEEGNSFWSFAGVVGVSFDTLSEWTKVHAEFSEAKKIGLGKLLLFDERLAKAGVSGQLKRHSRTIKNTETLPDGTVHTKEEQVYDSATFAQTYHIFMMKNRYPKMYRDKIVFEDGTDSTRNVGKTLMELMKDPAAKEAARVLALKMSKPDDSEGS